MLSSSSSSPTSAYFPHLQPSHYHHYHHQQKHHRRYHHHHQPSWSSSASSSFTPHQRQSGFLIDEYGIEHDPEHCQFKTVRQSKFVNRRRHHRSIDSLTSISSTSTTTTSTSSYHQPSPQEDFQLQPQPELHLTHPFALQSRQTRFSNQTDDHIQDHIEEEDEEEDEVDQVKSNQTKTKSNRNHFKSIWSHLSSPCLSPPSSSSSFLHSPLPPPHHQHQPHWNVSHVSYQFVNFKKKIQLVKLELRFGLLRTRKKVLRVWKRF